MTRGGKLGRALFVMVVLTVAFGRDCFPVDPLTAALKRNCSYGTVMTVLLGALAISLAWLFYEQRKLVTLKRQ